ncbi:PHM6-like protein [Saccharomyces kudriavzevii IFO 1802]|uniref:PHM6-like protein n=1 Tax=Saccharomyces kudriavzevii (strain ATCC MYA-4449 / AS 2.2408 / CBS 8840 / NBRC 1802 / NCYC 2889) TaxID=226230 RepID=J6EF92_SACK1|nr:PHM6-like protein [Saccharomyces kudriavzevii IFO 1802]
MEQQEEETTQVELVENHGEEEVVKCNEYMIDLEAGLLPHEGSGKSGTFKQCRDSFLGFIEELIIVIIIVLIFYSLTMAGLFYVMTMTKILF